VSELQDLAQRLAALAERVDQEAGLRASQDRDLASVERTLRAQHHTIQALAITQSDHNEKLDRVDEGVREANRSIQQLAAGVDRILVLLERLTDEQGA